MLDDDCLPFLGPRKCLDCGETDPLLLEVDHPGDVADFPSADIVLRDWENNPADLEDFQVVCASCHLRRARLRGPAGEVLRCWRNR